nr:hypothetical protein [Tanacetum cinerariifolium]
YVCQPLGFKEPNHPDKVYKVVKALYGLHQALRTCDSPLLGVNTPRCDEDRLELMELTVFLLPKVNDVTRLQALVDKKKVVVTEATIRDALHLDDEEGMDCLLNEEIFVELARMGYEKPSIKLTFYNAFFSSQVGKGFFGVETPLFESMLLEQHVDDEGDTHENNETANAGDAAEGDISAAHGEVPTVVDEPSIPSLTPPTQTPQPPQDIPSTS